MDIYFTFNLSFLSLILLAAVNNLITLENIIIKHFNILGWILTPAHNDASDFLSTATVSFSYLLLIPPSLAQLSIQAVSSRRPLLRQSADAALHEAERLFAGSNMIQQYRQVCAKGSL